MLTLVIGNKNYSSWSMRPWLVARHVGLAFEEILIPLDTPETAEHIRAHSPSGRVPCLRDGDVVVWESLAIIEYLAERAPEASVWPADPAARADARAIAAEMHAGFAALRAACPVNLRKVFPFRDWGGAAAAADVARIETIFAERLARSGGPFLYRAFTAADAMYAPVVARLTGYSWPLAETTRRYCEAVEALPAYAEWKAAALEEPWIVPSDEVAFEG